MKTRYSLILPKLHFNPDFPEKANWSIPSESGTERGLSATTRTDADIEARKLFETYKNEQFSTVHIWHFSANKERQLLSSYPMEMILIEHHEYGISV